MKASTKDEQLVKEKLLDITDALEDRLSAGDILFIVLMVNIFINLALYLFSRRIILNLNSMQYGLQSFFSFLKRESEDVKKIEVRGKDEFWHISNEINKQVQSIKENIQKDVETVDEISNISKIAGMGDFSKRITKDASNPQINELKITLNEFLDQMKRNVDSVVKTLDSYKTGELDKSVDIKSHGELKKLIDGVNDLGDELKEAHEKIEKSLRDKSIQLNESATLLDSSMKELHKCSIVQTKSSSKVHNQTEQINTLVKNTTKNAKIMHENAKDTLNMSKSGEELANKTYEAMLMIENATKEVGEAISKIDALAFSTNILSLNAAVEAATAGEAGKGFAVVANEVRSLASKSAEAAKYIKDLVENTQQKANYGMEISTKMQERFSLMSQKIDETYKLVEEVANEATNEEKMISDMKKFIDELKRISDKNRDITQTTNLVSNKILSVARELEEEVDTHEREEA
jgi:methyl-accepting chemotaxis protein